MEPYDLKLQQLTFTEDQLKDGSLDSFSNVIHYDSALLDQNTGRKPSTEQVENSQLFAWSNPKHKPPGKDSFLPSPFQAKPSIPAQSRETILPVPFQENLINPETLSNNPRESAAGNTVESASRDFACQISQLIKDVYSGVDVPFSPLKDQKNIPDWIFLQQSIHTDDSSSKQPEHIFAQPSRVKVTHVYNQTVWSQVPTTAPFNNQSSATPQTSLTRTAQNQSSHRPQTSQISAPHNQSIERPQTRSVEISAGADLVNPDINNSIYTLQQISRNTTAAQRFQTQQNINRMAESNKNFENTNSSQPFESVAEALHLQQSVIGNRAGLTPVSAEVVAQIVAEAERKLKLGHTTTPSEVQSQTSEFASGEPSAVFTLPPVPTLPDAATTRELIRIHFLDISRSSGGTAKQSATSKQPGSTASQNIPQPSDAKNTTQNSSAQNDTYRSQIPGVQVVSNVPKTSSQTTGVGNGSVLLEPGLDNLPDEDQSVASTNSELEALGDTGTDSFLQSLPPFRTVNLSEIMPEYRMPQLRHSPPVKETSFRPVNVKLAPVSQNATELPSFGSDSGVFSPESDKTFSPPPSHVQPNKTTFIVPKPGPLFQSTPRAKLPVKEYRSANSHVTSHHDSNRQLEEVRREKAKLEGQLEMLSIEAQATLQERAELQAQLASLKLKMMSQKSQRSDAEKDMLKADLESLKQLRVSLEQSLSDLQRELEEKAEEGRNLQDDLNQSQEHCDKLNLKMKELRDDLKSKEMTIQALKNKVAELYVEVQTSMQSRMESENEARSARSDLVSLQSTRDWYQQQLEIASKARSELQKELTVLQAQTLSQSSIVDRLKAENIKLRQQYTDIQNKALKEKELLAKHLETIESDMMDREAAFQEIQRERSFLEDTFNTKIQTAEDEKSRIGLLMQMTNDLENQLDKAHSDLKRKQNQINQLESENIELMKKLRLSQDCVVEKENLAEELKHSVIEMEAKLNAFQNSIGLKDTEILALKEDKAKTEIALNAALQEKNAVDKVLDGVKLDMGKVETSFKLMRQELNSKSAEVNQVKTLSKGSEEKIESLKSELENEKRTYELAKLEYEKKTDHINELQSQKISLESEVLVLREKLASMETSHEEAIKEKQFLDTELGATRDKLEEVKAKLQAQNDREESEVQKSSVVNTAELLKVQEECVQLREQIAELGQGSKKDLMKQKAKSAKLSKDLNAVKSELMERQKTFDENIELLSGKLREVASEKEKLETELVMVHRKYELSMLEQKDHIDAELQNLASELQHVQLEKQSLESHVRELQHARETDLHQYQQQLSALEEELRLAMESQSESSITQETNQNLLLELEKEKGRLAGALQSNSTLKQHVGQLEEALAGRESTLVDLQAQWTQALREKELEAHESIKRVQNLEECLQKEKEGQRDVRKQIGLKITENKKLRRQNDSLKQEQEQLKLDCSHLQQEVSMLQTDLETSKEEVISKQGEISSLESENKSIQRELDRVQQQLYDNLSREPVLQEQIQGLKWQLELKTQELEAAQQQCQHTEERHQGEITTVKQLLQEKTREIESLKLDMASMKHDKQLQQAKLSELRSALKSSIHYHKLVEKISKIQSPKNSGDADLPELPPLPFDLSDMDKLLQETTVRALESKPLDNLQNCLLNLRSEISGLQAQMDVHNNTLETSTHNWSSIEQQVEELRHVVQTISNTTMSTATTASLAAAAVDTANRSMDIIDI